jgi:hypothetical protein
VVNFHKFYNQNRLRIYSSSFKRMNGERERNSDVDKISGKREERKLFFAFFLHQEKSDCHVPKSVADFFVISSFAILLFYFIF